MQNDQGLVIAFPHAGMVHVPWMMSVMNFREFDGQNQRVLKAVLDKGGMYVSANRNELAKGFLEIPSKPSWFLTLDTDHTFIPEQVYQLLDDADPIERPIVSALYFNLFNKHLIPMWWDRKENGEYVTVRTVGPHLQQIAAAGMGMTLIHRSVLEKIQERYDHKDDNWIWFGHDMGSAGGDPGRLGEDFTFFKRAAACGFPVWGDGRIVIGHLKTCLYDIDMFMKLGDFLKEDEPPRERVLHGAHA